MAKKTDDSVRSKFFFREISAKSGERWRIKIGVRRLLPEALMSYQVTLALDEEPFMEEIEGIEKNIRNANANPELFDDAKSQARALQRELADANKKLKEARETYPPFEFTGTIEEVKFDRANGITFATLSVDDVDALKLADMRHDMKSYKIELV